MTELCSIGQSCMIVPNAMSGVISDSSTTSARSCSWFLTPSQSPSGITFSVTSLTLANGDWLAFRQGSGTGPVSRNFTSSSSGIQTFTVSGSSVSVYVQYVKRSSTSSNFALSYYATPTSLCSGTVYYYGPAGIISSCNTGGTYQPNMNCLFVVQPPSPTDDSITFTSTLMSLETGYDFVRSVFARCAVCSLLCR